MPSVQFDILSIVAIAGGVQGLLLGFACLSGKSKRSSIFLGSFLLLVSLHILYISLLHTKLIYRVPHLVGVMDPFNFIYIPIFYFYILSIVKPTFKFRWLHLAHILPFTWYTHKIKGLYGATAEYKIQHLDYFYRNLEYTNDWGLNFMILLYAGAYLGSAVWVFKLQSKRGSSFRINHSQKRSGVRLILGGFVLVYLAKCVRVFVAYETQYIMIEGVFTAFLFYVIGYLALIKPKFIYGLQNTPNQISGLTIPANLILHLDTYMRDKKPYLDNHLTLSKLASALELSPQKLSNVINQHYGSSFFNYINKYRVKDAKILLLHGDQKLYTLEKIYKDVGFNSKSSFHSAFKKFTNLTPVQYKNSIPDKGVRF